MRIYNGMQRRDAHFVQFSWVEDLLSPDPLVICETFRLCDNGQYVKGLEDIKSRYSRLTTGGN